ncbi:hypothetical protein LWI29_020149 [Acer saccharum]|uniref:ABC transporter domain-containing protein n=1 Tax=Acer saccharum TaxID=4024 RepID=A0AA39VP12_ACESA|nr:hypothetical protein LWI29_020149 [Acer saccharum]
MNLQRGLPLLHQQYKALFKKNFRLSWRNKQSVLLQLFPSFFFIFLMFCIDKGLNYGDDRGSVDSVDRLTDPKPILSPPIPPCEDKLLAKKPCFDFLWTADGGVGNQNQRIQKIVDGIMNNNPGRKIPPHKVKSFKTKGEVNNWFIKNPLSSPGALHFEERNASVISYGIQTSTTQSQLENNPLNLPEDPTFDFQIPLQIAAEREIARSLVGDPNFIWVVGLKEFAHPAWKLVYENQFTKEDKISSTDIGMGPTFFLAIAMFGFVFQIRSLVTEKELKLRQAMNMMGLYDTAYWLSWLTWEGIMTLVSSLSVVIFGLIFQFDFFLKNNIVLLFLLFFLFQLNMTGYAFMLSAFISKSSSSTRVGFFNIYSWICNSGKIVTQIGFPYNKPVQFKRYGVIWSLFPPNLLTQALKLLTTDPKVGVTWSERTKCPPDDAEGGCCCTGSVPVLEHVTPDDEDVLEEENNVKEQAKGDMVESNVAVQIRGLVKTYPGTRKMGCCKCKKTLPFHAVKGLWMNVDKHRLFCLLGPNGAGKTTIISCLTGITPVTAGDAFVYGDSIRSSTGLSNIRRTIGVCPQFDILWDELSAQEHLQLFASIKGLPPASIKSVAENSLAEVRLTEAAKVRAGSYSGGMKRRLSVAIALIGDPKLIILDEPTTGMDPISRRHVWDIIENAKRGRAIILTTHSMEEADILGDRIGIMAKGRLRCIGSSIRLKSRFGTGFITNIRFTGSNNGESPSNEDTIVTTHHEAVKQFFKYLQYREREFGIADIQLGLTTLEEVFLNIARQAELENSQAEGRLVTLTLTSGASVEIPFGARFVGIPGTETAENPRGIMVEVHWETDDSGALNIAGHSPETPIPPSVRMSDFSVSTSNSLGRNAQVRGIVIEPSQLGTTGI